MKLIISAKTFIKIELEWGECLKMFGTSINSHSEKFECLLKFTMIKGVKIDVR